MVSRFASRVNAWLRTGRAAPEGTALRVRIFTAANRVGRERASATGVSASESVTHTALIIGGICVSAQTGVPVLTPKPISPVDPRSQGQKFEDLARELECDDDENAFKERVRQMATAPRGDAKPAKDH